MTNKDRIRASLDHRYYLHALILSGIVWLLFILGVALVLRDIAPDRSTVWILCVAVGGFPLYYAIRLGHLYTHAEDYRVCTARYKAVHFSGWKRGMRGYAAFTLTVEQANGTHLEVKSRYIFPMSALSTHHLGEYLDVPLEVLYREDTGRLIVVGRLAP